MIVQLVPLPKRLALARCPACGEEFEDMEANLMQDGRPSPCCGRLTEPVYEFNERSGRWEREF